MPLDRHHWVGHLANYNFSLKYIKGNTNVVADALSRVEVRLDPAMVSATLAGLSLDWMNMPRWTA